MKFKTQKSNLECRNDAIAPEGAEGVGMKKILVASAVGAGFGVISGLITNVISDKIRSRREAKEDAPAAKKTRE